jgi:PKD repeat protein
VTRPPAWLGLPVVALAVAALALPGTSDASHQAFKNGCTSTDRISGSLTSPRFLPAPVNALQLQLRTWWELESSRPASADRLTVSIAVDGGDFFQVASFPQASAASGAPDVPLSNIGLQQRPAWQQETIDLSEAVSASAVQLRFSFDSVDARFNGFRGWAIDDIAISDGFGTPVADIDFDASSDLPTGWTATGFWRVQQNPQAVSIAPGINPQLVTLGAGDDGSLPAAFSGSGIAWFGQPETGTYCGAGSPAENFQPAASFTASPSSPRTSDVITFDGSSSSDLDGPLSSYVWDFGDGTPVAAGPTAAHTYTKAGTYNVSLTVTDAAGASSTAIAPLQVATNLPAGILVADGLDALPNPRPFRNFNIEPTGGEVFVQLPAPAPGAAGPAQAPPGFIPLTQAAQLPVGTLVETTRGKVMLESARDRRGRLSQRGEFFDGRFRMRQPRISKGNPVTELLLKGGSFRDCPRIRQSASWSRTEQSQRRRSRRVRRLWGNGRGRFRTRGRYSSATVRGTKWLVEDRCNGTLTRLPRRPRTSRVDVRDLVTRRTIRLRAGRSYLARPRAGRR